MNNKILFGVGGIVVGVIIAVLLSPGVQFGSMMWGGNYSNNPISSRTAGMTSRIDQHFIEQMIPHHEGAIAMARLALEKSKRSEIKTLANAIIEGQTKEIKDMTGWYESWFEKDVPKGSTVTMGGGMMSGGGMHMGGQEDMQTLVKAVDFDRAFIEAMIPHHQLAIMMAQMLRSSTDRSEMTTLANNIMESQSKEIADMQGWYTQWYK